MSRGWCWARYMGPGLGLTHVFVSKGMGKEGGKWLRRRWCWKRRVGVGWGAFGRGCDPPPCAHGPIVDSGSLVKRVDGLLDLD